MTPAKISESQLQSAILDLARTTGWIAYHTHDSRRSEAGFPDLLMCRRDRIVAAELKSARGVVSGAQERWLEALQSGGAEVYVWRPEDWLSGAVEAILR